MKEEIEKFIKEREKHQMEFQRLDQKASEYKEQIKNGTFNIEIQWETDITQISLDKLRTSLIDEIKNNLITDYEIVNFDLDKVVNRHCTNADNIYPKNNLWKLRQPHDIARLIEFVENGNKIIPPMILPTSNTTIAILDGNHRIALCRFLKLSHIPFIVKKDTLNLIDDLK